MKVIVFGATGRTGKLAVDRALAKGYEVTVFVRDANRMRRQDVRVAVGDALNLPDVQAAMQGQDAVIATIGGTTPWRQTGLEGKTAVNIAKAMQGAGTRRLVIISMMGVGDSLDQAPSFYRTILMPTFLRGVTKDKAALEHAVAIANVDSVIVRPPMLVNSPATGMVKVLGENETGHRITRADLADFMVGQIESDRYARQAVTVVNR